MVTISNEDLVYNDARLQEVCDLFDSYYIANSMIQMDKRYVAVSGLVHSDGSYTKEAHRDGFVYIENVKDANYIVYIDKNKELSLAVYRYTSESKLADIELICKEIRNNMHELIWDDEDGDGVPDNNTINVEDPRCPFCNSPIVVCNNSMGDKMLYVAKCNDCNKGYVLEPDDNYRITSITNYNNKKERNAG